MQVTQTIKMGKILIVDDEYDIRHGLANSLESLGYEVAEAGTGEEALFYLKNPANEVNFVITDYKMPGMDGFDVLKEAKKKNPDLPVVIMTGHGGVHHAVEAIQRGANDYLCKPFRFEELEKIVEKDLVAREMSEEACELPETLTKASSDMISNDPELLHILAKAERVANSDAPVLIEGPSGTGKELLARQIHDWSPRANEPWVAINCAALPAGLLESELFGFEKGSFTGALEKRSGKFEQANGGTLLLDEIGELDPILQAKLLRVLQEGEVDRIGGKKPMKVNVRIIATTNKSLESLVRQSKFREDLYFRLYGVRFGLPSLNDRKADIPLLAEKFLERNSLSMGRNLYFADGVLESLQGRLWSGNIRELERAVERAAILAESNEVSLKDFDFEKKDSGLIKAFGSPSNLESASRTIKEMERDTILSALEDNEGNRTHAAKSLGMSLRTLRHKLKTYREEGVYIAPARQDAVGNTYRYAQSDAGLEALRGDS